MGFVSRNAQSLCLSLIMLSAEVNRLSKFLKNHLVLITTRSNIAIFYFTVRQCIWNNN